MQNHYNEMWMRILVHRDNVHRYNREHTPEPKHILNEIWTTIKGPLYSPLPTTAFSFNTTVLFCFQRSLRSVNVANNAEQVSNRLVSYTLQVTMGPNPYPIMFLYHQEKDWNLLSLQSLVLPNCVLETALCSFRASKNGCGIHSHAVAHPALLYSTVNTMATASTNNLLAKARKNPPWFHLRQV